MTKPLASLSVDLDNKWSYLRTHGHEGWQTYPSYLSTVVPRMLRVLDDLDVPATIFVVGKDAAVPENANLWRDVVAAGHEIANHSFRHQPWLHRYSRGELVDDIVSGEEAIERATGQRPVGFRGPGFSITEEALAVLAERGYVYDATMFPTFIGPLANLYGRLISRREDPGQPGNRGRMFGSATDGLRTLRPHWLETPAGPLLEIPVTTMPLFRLPIHMTYLHFLAQISTRAAKMYWRCALRLCQWRCHNPSLLLHPLDFLGMDDEPELNFFPGMRQPSDKKLRLVRWVLATLAECFNVVTLLDQAQALGGGARMPGEVKHEPAPIS